MSPLHRALLDKYPCIDRKQVALYGHDYGAHITARTIATDRWDTFACGLLFQPFHNWNVPPATYVARYLGDVEPAKHMPTIAYVRNIRPNKPMLVVHGYDFVSRKSSHRVKSAFGGGIQQVSAINPSENSYKTQVRLLLQFIQRCFPKAMEWNEFLITVSNVQCVA